MEVQCHHCGQVHRIPREVLDIPEEQIHLSCTNCGNAFQVPTPRLKTLRSEPTRQKVESVISKLNFEGRELQLPPGRDVALKVLEGEEKGTVYPVQRPRVTLGRSNADINVNDPAASRVHCAIEITAQGVLLRDLDSTNGTLVNNKPVKTVELASGSCFKIGAHVFQLLITPKGQ